jgi:hypothetical protein
MLWQLLGRVRFVNVLDVARFEFAACNGGAK